MPSQDPRGQRGLGGMRLAAVELRLREGEGRSWVEAPGVCVCVCAVCGGGGMWMRSGLSFFLSGLS